MGQTIIQRGSGGGSGSAHALLDGSTHNDTVAQTVSRGSLIYGDSTPKWNELTLGGARKAVMSDGTDALWRYPGMVYLASATASASASVDFTLTGWTNGDFAAYMVVLSHVAPATDGVNLWLRTSTDGGATYDSGAGTYRYAGRIEHDDTGSANFASAGDTKIILNRAANTLGSAANETFSGVVFAFDPSAAKYGTFWWAMQYQGTDTSIFSGFGGGARITAADVDAIQFLMSSGNIASGEFRLYGIPDA